MNPYRNYSTRQTPQSEPIPGSSQVPDSAGGYAWALDIWGRLDRFLVLGTEGGTYYIEEQKLTQENAESVRRCIRADGARVVKRIVEISDAGRAPKNDPAIFALAMTASLGDELTRKAAFAALPKVCRIGTHLFHFAAYAEQFRGWGRGLRRAVANWYLDKPTDDLAYQLVKYQTRDGWGHRDLLRLCHPRPTAYKVGDSLQSPHGALFQWVTHPGTEHAELPMLIEAAVAAQVVTTKDEIVKLIRGARLPRECIPTRWLKEAAVWEALLEDMPMTAMIRNLATMTRVGLIAHFGSARATIVGRLQDGERLKRARVHPIAVLAALLTYQSGHGARGKGEWEPVTAIVDALDAAFYASFGNVEPSNKRLMLALDVSGSMTSGEVAGIPGLTPRVGAAAMALITAATEPQHCFTAFCDQMIPLTISPRQRLDDVCKIVHRTDFGGTDCSLPMLYALEQKIEVDAFVVYTDSETWAGSIHPSQALVQYRQKTGIPAKLIVVGMTSNGFTIADPNDAGMLDVVGFDTATPNVISDFVV